MYSSETFGRWFWVDDNYEFKSCPLNVDGTGDFNCEDYVSEWDDFTDVDMNELLNIHKFCILNKINYAGSLTHKEEKVYPQVDNIPEQVYNDWLYNKDNNYGEKVDRLVDNMGMREYMFDEQFYKEIVKDSKFSFGKFNDPDYPIHLSQS